MHISGVENIVVRHPAYFHENYMTGEGYYVRHDNVQSEIQQFNSTSFNAFLCALYVQPRFLSVGLTDTVLWSYGEVFTKCDKRRWCEYCFYV